jgi:hypothetical protein
MSPNANVAIFCCVMPLIPVLLTLGTWFLLRGLANRRPRLTVTPLEDPEGKRRHVVIELEMEERPRWSRRHRKEEEAEDD